MTKTFSVIDTMNLSHPYASINKIAKIQTTHQKWAIIKTDSTYSLMCFSLKRWPRRDKCMYICIYVYEEVSEFETKVADVLIIECLIRELFLIFNSNDLKQIWELFCSKF